MANDFSVCPRCESKTVEVAFKSPVEGVWEVMRCTTCHYTFRTTEPEELTNPEKYDPTFKLDPNELDNFPMMPAIPPLRHK